MNVHFFHADPAALQECRAQLEESGIYSKVFSSAVAGIFALAFRSDLAAVISRCPMSGMRGEDLLRLCHQVAPGVPVILWLDERRTDRARQGDLGGAFAVIRGPLTPDDLVPVLMRVMTLRPVHCLDGLHMT